VSRSVAAVSNERTTEVLLRRQRIVRSAAKSNVHCVVGAAFAEGLDMVQLEAMRFTATQSSVVDVRAAAAIAFEGCAPHLCRHSAAALASRVASRAVSRVRASVVFRLRRAFVMLHFCLTTRALGWPGIVGRASTVRRGASRLFRQGIAPLLEFDHQCSHRTHVEIVERGVRNRMGKERPCPFDELHVLFTRRELHPVSLRPLDGWHHGSVL
jgi:hypothetical protein